MEEHVAFGDNGMQYIQIQTEELPNFEDNFVNSHQLIHENKTNESYSSTEFQENRNRMIMKNTNSISKNNDNNSCNNILGKDEKVDPYCNWNMKMISPNLLIQDNDEFMLSPLNDSINYQQTLSSSVKSTTQQQEHQSDKCTASVESSDKLLNIPYPSHFQNDYQEEEQQHQQTDNIENNISNSPIENDLYVISPSFTNSDVMDDNQQQQQQQNTQQQKQEAKNDNSNNSLYISDENNITKLPSPSDPLLPESFQPNNRNMNKSNSFPFYNNNNNNNTSPPLLPLSSNNLPIPFNENNDLFINNPIMNDDNSSVNSWNNDWCNNQQYYTPLLSQDIDYNLFNTNIPMNSTIDSNNNYTQPPVFLHSRKRNSLQDNSSSQQQQQHEYSQSEMTLMKRPKVPMSNRVCHECGTTVTPKWRRSPPPHRYILCNACGLQYTKDIEKGYYPSAINQMNSSNLCQGRECVNARKNGIKLYRRLFNRKLKLCYYCNKERMIKSNSSSSFTRHSNDSTDTDSNSAYI